MVRGPLDYDAEFHDVSADVNVTPKPESKIPIMYGGSVKPAVRRAARVADAWCAPSSLSIEGVRKRKEDIERVRETEDIGGDFEVYVLQHGFVADSKEEAWEAMKAGLSSTSSAATPKSFPANRWTNSTPNGKRN